MIEPVFTSKLRYALALLVDITAKEKDTVLKSLHHLHRQAMKVALGLERQSGYSDQELFDLTGQKSVLFSARVSTAKLSWSCAKDWEGHALTRERLDHHHGGRTTRQNSRVFPPQRTKSSLMHRIVETWETLPVSIKQEDDERTVRPKIKEWARTLM